MLELVAYAFWDPYQPCNLDMVKLMIEKGAKNEWNSGLNAACQKRNRAAHGSDAGSDA